MNISVARQGDQDEAASRLLKALANPHRLRIGRILAEGEITVGALADSLGLRESLVSQHLGVMRREKLVSARRVGQTVFYALEDQKARDVIGLLA